MRFEVGSRELTNEAFETPLLPTNRSPITAHPYVRILVTKRLSKNATTTLLATTPAPP